jgi:pimeloyl-ACP methyl ester carboxylesterase
LAIVAFVLSLLFALAGVTRAGVWKIERDNPPVGEFADVNGTRMHYVHVPAGPGADLPPLVFIHGASGNLKDPMVPFLPMLKGRGELVFLDRPGHGASSLGPEENLNPDGQAKTIAALLDHLKIKSAIIVGHSYGGSVTANLALGYPEKIRGLLFLSAASHPWPGCDVAAYYDLTTTPVLGWIFSQTLALPAGLLSLKSGSIGVFAPNPMPQSYVRDASISSVLRPGAFRVNAGQVVRLCSHSANHHRFGQSGFCRA